MMITKAHWLSVLILSLAILAVAWSPNSAQAQAVTGDALAEPGARFDEVLLIKGPVSDDGLQAIFGTPDLGLGTQRIGVVLTSPQGLVRSPLATFATYFVEDGEVSATASQTSVAFFNPFPLNTRGIYTAKIDFDRPGKWRLEISILDDNAKNLSTEIEFHVNESAAAPSAGEQAIASKIRTIRDVESVAELTTGSLQDPDLYQISIADAVASGKPTMIVMVSPAFCTNAVCGPQVDILQQLKDAYKGQANFIHVDIYENPLEIQGDLDRGVISSTVREWNLPSTEWSFVITSSGIVHERFESFTGYDELETSLKEVL